MTDPMAACHMTPTRDAGAEAHGVLVLHSWAEGPERELRVRITQTLNLDGREQRVSSAATIEDALAAVASWLEAFKQYSGATE